MWRRSWPVLTQVLLQSLDPQWHSNLPLQIRNRTRKSEVLRWLRFNIRHTVTKSEHSLDTSLYFAFKNKQECVEIHSMETATVTWLLPAGCSKLPSRKGLAGSQSRCGRFGEEKNLFSLLGIELQLIGFQSEFLTSVIWRIYIIYM